MIALRAANTDDCDLLFNWVNQPDSLRNKSRTTGPIPYNAHTEWYSQALHNSQYYLWIIEENREAAGQMRFSPQPEGFEVDIYIAGAFRKRNLAVTALSMGVREVCGAHAGKTLIAYIKEDNLASRKLFERAGFSLLQDANPLKVYRLTIDKGED
mgnify:CR=1 FL=1